MKQILIAGGTGFLGQVLTRHFHLKGWQVTILTRQLNAQNLTPNTRCTASPTGTAKPSAHGQAKSSKPMS